MSTRPSVLSRTLSLNSAIPNETGISGVPQLEIRHFTGVGAGAGAGAGEGAGVGAGAGTGAGTGAGNGAGAGAGIGAGVGAGAGAGAAQASKLTINNSASGINSIFFLI